MSEWDNNYDNNYDNNNYGNNEYNSYENNNNEDSLDNLFNDENSYVENNQEEHENQTVEESNLENNHGSNDSSNNQTITWEEVKPHLTKIPSNIKSDKIFSEKECYRIHNLALVLSEVDEDLLSWTDSVLDINARDNIRRSISIIQMDEKEFSQKAETISAIKSIYDISVGGNDDEKDPIEAVMQALMRVEDLTESQRNDVLSLMRKILRFTGSKSRITATRNSSALEIAHDIRNVMIKEEDMTRHLESLGNLVDTIYNISKM